MIELIPAIDIIDGKCVRLSQGNYNSKKVYNENPLEVAKEFEAYGIRIGTDCHSYLAHHRFRRRNQDIGRYRNRIRERCRNGHTGQRSRETPRMVL